MLRVQGQPKASKSEVVGEIQDGDGVRLKIRIQAPPLDGEANEELLRFLKKALKAFKPTSLELLRGQQSRQKDVLIRGITRDQLEAWVRENTQNKSGTLS